MLQKRQIANILIGSFIAYSVVFGFCYFFVLSRYRGGLLEKLVELAPTSFCTMGGLALIILVSDWYGGEAPKPSKVYYALMGLVGVGWIVSCRALLRGANAERTIDFIDYSVVVLLWILALRKMHRVHKPGQAEGNS